jgi:hypothetical protein
MAKSDILRKFSMRVVSSFEYNLLSYYKDPKVVDLIKLVKKETETLLTPYEAYTIYSVAKTRSILEGDMAEVGVYQGGSAKIICEAKGNRRLYLFDTFEGLPNVSEVDAVFEDIKFFKEKKMNETSYETVKKYLSNYNNIYIYKGKFPDTSDPIKNSVFSFVHLDVDIYESTINCLNFFFPRLVSGGIIISHDYATSQGVRKAFDDFFNNNKHLVIELTEQQCMVIKIS